MAFDQTKYGKLLAIMERLAEPKALTPNERPAGKLLTGAVLEPKS